MNPVDYRIAEPADSGDIVRLLAAAFSASEPPAVAMGLTFRDMEQFLGLIVPRIIADGLTAIARDLSTERLVGVVLTDDFALPPALDVSQINPNFLPILSMLETLDAQYHAGRNISAGQYLHLFMLGVDGRFAGRGVGKGVVKICLENGFRKGYRAALTEATGAVSQHIFRKHDFVDRFRISYRDFKYEDKAVFASIQEHEGAILMEKSPLA